MKIGNPGDTVGELWGLPVVVANEAATDFKAERYPDGSFAFVEFPDPIFDDGRPVVTLRATFRINGGKKCFIHLPVTRSTLKSVDPDLLERELHRQADWLARHPERIGDVE